jgi:hypothetical protein
MVNRPMNPKAYSIGVSHDTLARHIVAVQLKTLMPDGIATSIDRNEKMLADTSDSVLTNMWWPHTVNPSTAMAMLEKAMNV